MTALRKPTADELRLIREAAHKEAGSKRVRIEPGRRINIDDGRENLNIFLISDDPDWNDTDLADFESWSDFRRGFEMAPGRCALIDFYVSTLGRDGELQGNVTARWINGHLVNIAGTTCNWWSAQN